MKKLFKNKKIIFSAVAISILAYFAISANFAEAQNNILPIFNGTVLPKAAAGGGAAIAGQFATAIGVSALNATKWGVVIFGVLNILQYVLWWLISYGYTLLTAAVNMALDPNWFQIDAVLNGWRLVRDFANIWFILILLFIAIGTILRAQSYQAKKLLPTLIMVAMVINFSLPITGFIIDISNIISFQFLKAICPEVKDGEHCDFSANLENALDVKGFSQSLAENLPVTPENPPEGNGSETGLLGTQKAQAVAPLVIAAGVWKVIQVVSAVGIAWDLGNSLFTQASPLGGVAIGPFVSIVVTNIFLLLTAFVIISLALLFLIRIASLIFLAILSPLGFAAAIIPATQKYSQMWWNYLFTQSFFAPFSLFFLWISLSLMGNIKDALTQSGVAYDFTSPANARIIFYIFSLMLMYGSIWIAKQMGAMGADAVIKWWGSIQKGIAGFAGGLAGRLLVAPIGAAALGAGIPQAITRIPGIGPLAGVKTREFAEYLSKRGKAPEQAAAKAELGMQLAPAERAGYFRKLDLAAKEAMLRKMKPEDREVLLSDIGKMSPAEAEAARQILRSATFAPEEKAKMEIEKLQRLSLGEQVREFSKLSPDTQNEFLLSIKDDDQRAAFISQLATSDLDAAQRARNFLQTSPRFTATERAKREVEDFQRKWEGPDQQKHFGELSEAAQQDFLMRFTDNDRRAEFIAGVADPTKGNNQEAATKAREFLETSNLFTAGQRFDYKKARMKQEMIIAEKSNDLIKFIDDFAKDAETDEQKKTVSDVQKVYFKAMDDRQRLALLEAWSGDTSKLNNLRDWVLDMKPEDQDKFYRETVGKQASVDTVVSFVDSIKTESPEKDFVTKKKMLSAASPQQLAKLQFHWKQPGTENPEMVEFINNIRETQFTIQQQNSFNNMYSNTSKNFFNSTIQIRTSKEIAEELRTRSDKKDGDAVKQIVEAVKATNRTEDLDIITKVEFVDGVDSKNIEIFQSAITNEIKNMAPQKLEQKITAESLDDTRVATAVLESFNMEKLILLFKNPVKSKKLQEIILGNIVNTMKGKIDAAKRAEGLTPQELLSPLMQDKSFAADALTETFEKKFKNKILAEQLTALWSKEKPLSPLQKLFKKEVFE